MSKIFVFVGFHKNQKKSPAPPPTRDEEKDSMIDLHKITKEMSSICGPRSCCLQDSQQIPQVHLYLAHMQFRSPETYTPIQNAKKSSQSSSKPGRSKGLQFLKNYFHSSFFIIIMCYFVDFYFIFFHNNFHFSKFFHSCSKITNPNCFFWIIFTID